PMQNLDRLFPDPIAPMQIPRFYHHFAHADSLPRIHATCPLFSSMSVPKFFTKFTIFVPAGTKIVKSVDHEGLTKITILVVAVTKIVKLVGIEGLGI
ncbi:MAG: hypothetical protein ACK5VX_09355, partial [Akkermansiaceae bacterium]